MTTTTPCNSPAHSAFPTSRRLHHGVPCARAWAAGWVVLAVAMLSACGGSGEGGQSAGAAAPTATPPTPTSSPPPTSPPQAGEAPAGELRVRVVDLLQAPVENASVQVLEGVVAGTSVWSPAVLTDRAGMAVLRNVSAGADRSILVEHASRGSNSDNASVVAGGSVFKTITLIPRNEDSDPEWIGAVTAAHVVEGSASPDGRSVSVRLSVHIASEDYPGNSRFGPPSSSANELRLRDCTPQRVNDMPSVHADCVRGPVGYDAGYHVTATSLEATPYPLPYESGAFGSTLLLDQGDAMVTADGRDRRLFAAKYLLSLARSDDHVWPAAYAGDNPATGFVSMLPTKPVYYLAEDPPVSMIQAVDELAGLEGGLSPTLAALEAALSQTAVGGGRPDVPKSIIALVSDIEHGCGATEACAAAREALIRRGQQLDVAFHLLVLDDAAATGAQPDVEAMAEMASRTGGSLWMLPNADTLLPAFSALARQLHRETSQYLVTLRLEGEPGTFTSGRVVHGKLTYDNQEAREWGYNDLAFDMPFAVRIP